MVAIIAILAAIAVPNFPARPGARQDRPRPGDHHNLAVAIGPIAPITRTIRARSPAPLGQTGPADHPIRYITTNPLDVFKPWDNCPRDTDRGRQIMRTT
ncbi:hypothetical protein HS125_16135 [bacterium]|nr:hypothetical protein [bacterium]